MSIKRRYTLEELSEITAFTKRTLRNYIQKGLHVVYALENGCLLRKMGGQIIS